MNRRFPLFWLALYRRRRMLVALLLGSFVFEGLIIFVARAIPPHQLFAEKGLSSNGNIPSALQAFSGSTGDVSLASYAGLLGAGLMHPFWIAMQLTAIGSFGAAVVAADVEAGTIELLMVRPLSRLRLLCERIAALVVAMVVLNVGAVGALVIGVATSSAMKQEISVSGVLVAGLAGLAFGLSIAGPVVAISAAGNRKSQVIAATVAIGAVSYAMNFISQAWHPLAVLRWLSPFHYYAPADALAIGHSTPWLWYLLLVAVGVGGFGVAAVLLHRRDIVR